MARDPMFYSKISIFQPKLFSFCAFVSEIMKLPKVKDYNVIQRKKKLNQEKYCL